MLNREYRFRFYLNARHAIKIEETESDIHPHTWEIVLHVVKKTEGFVQFTRMEKAMQVYLAKYEGRLVNEIPPFDTVTPTLENMGEVFHFQVEEFLKHTGWELNRLEISENPARTYILSGPSTNPVEPKPYPGEFGVVEKNPFCDLPHEAEKLPEEAALEISAAQEDLAVVEPGSMPAAGTEACPDGEKEVNSEKASGRLLYLVLSTFLILTASVLLIFWITRKGTYPWGSDSWYHLFKGNLLYNEIRAGNLFPLYADQWYNGIQPLRYWAPLAHYLLALFEFVTGGQIAPAYNLFIGFVFVAGAFGWILWGLKTGRRWLALALALLWFFLPDNLRVLFSEGNLSRVVVTTLFPYLLLNVTGYLQHRKRKNMIAIFLCMLLITLSHAMISAMVGITLFIFVLWYALSRKKLRRAVEVLAGAVSGIMLAGIWLYPALKGGLVSQDREAVLELMKGLTFSVTESLNPVLKLHSPDTFYFGISIVLLSLLGLLFGDKKSKAGFGTALIIFIGTTKALLPVLVKIPMSQLFWMMRFTPLAMGVFFAGLFMWRKIKRKVLIVAIILLAIDCGIAFNALGHNAEVPQEVAGVMDRAVDTAVQRIAVLDESSFGSFPSFYISYNKAGKKVLQAFGSGWQGAETAPNIMALNTALEKEWYAFLFDRCLELGADTVVVKKDKVKDYEELLEKSAAAGYVKTEDTDLCLIFKYPVTQSFATKVEYKGLGIGSYASNLAFIFPQFEIGGSSYVDDYTLEDLMQYETVYLSGFKYRDRTAAENLVRQLSEKGTKVVVDLTNAQPDFYTSRASFLGVSAQPVVFKGRYPLLESEGRTLEIRSAIPEEYAEWRTFYLDNLDRIYGKADFNNQDMNFWGSRFNDNLVFLAFNLPFFAMETGDSTAIGILETLTGFEASHLPEREIVRLDIITHGNQLDIVAEKEGSITGIAGLDSFRSLTGEYSEKHNLVYMEGKELKLRVEYPYMAQGLLLSLTGLIGAVLLCVFPFEKRMRLHEGTGRKNAVNLKMGGMV